MHSLIRAAINGSIAGAVATTTMTAFMRLTQQTGLYQKELPPTKVTRAATKTLGIRHFVSSEEETLLTGIMHWAFGMVGGACFGIASKASDRMPARSGGLVFGLLVWAVSYMGWVPALGILPMPWNERGKHGLMPLFAHVIYGATLGMVFDRLEQR